MLTVDMDFRGIWSKEGVDGGDGDRNGVLTADIDIRSMSNIDGVDGDDRGCNRV